MSYNPLAGGGGGAIADGSVNSAKLGGDVTTYGRGLLTAASPAAQRAALGVPMMARALLDGPQPNSTVTPVVLTGATFTLAPGQTGKFTAILVCTAAATTTGVAAGFRVAQGAGANAAARGSWGSYVNLANAPAATGLADGDVWTVAAGANAYGETLGTATTAGNNGLMVTAIVHNASTNATTTVTFEFRSEVAGSAVTAQVGSGVVALIG